MLTTKATKDYAFKIAQLFKQTYPNPKTELIFENDYQLAVAVMLSAQTTDRKVNEVTPNLFKKYPTWDLLSTASLRDVEKLIHGVNFHKGKAARLIKAGELVSTLFAGVLPKDVNELQKIPGVARKSANVILQELWDIAEGVVVDTHVSRVSAKLGLTLNKDPKKIEKDLMDLLPKEYWRNFSGACVLHGRYICKAKNPNCKECVFNKICPSVINIK